MKKSLILILTASSLAFANSPQTSTKNLEDFFKTQNGNDYKCTNLQCISKDFKTSKNSSNYLAKKITINLDFKKNFIFDYNKSKLEIKAKNECKNVVNDSKFISLEEAINKCENEIKDKELNKLFLVLMKNFKNLTMDDITFTKDNSSKTISNNIVKGSISKVYFEMDNNIFKIKDKREAKKAVTIKDFILNLKIKIDDMKTDDPYDILTNDFKSLLPKDYIVSMTETETKTINNGSGGIFTSTVPKKIEIKLLKDLNSKYKVMYEKLISEYLKNNKLSNNIEFSLNTKEISKDELKLTIDNKYSMDKNINSKILLEIDFKDVVKTQKLLSKVDLKGFGFISVLQGIGDIMYFNKMVSINNISGIRTIHNKLLKSDNEYKLNYNEILKIVNDENSLKEALGKNNEFKLFEYKTLSLQKDKVAILIENKDMIKMTMLVTMLMNPSTNYKDILSIIIK